MISEEDKEYIQNKVKDVKNALGTKRKELEKLDKEDRAKVVAFHDPKNGPLNYSNPEIQDRYLDLATLEKEMNLKIEAIYTNLKFPETTGALLRRSAEKLAEEYLPKIELI